MLLKIFNKKHIAIIITAIMLIVSWLGTCDIAHATLSKKPAPVQTETVTSSDRLAKENFKVRTPLNTKGIIYVSGKTTTDVKRLCIRIKQHNTSSYAVTVFVTPNSKGEFSIKINVKKGNKTVPAVIDGKGTVIQAKSSYGTQPGYKAVPEMKSGIYHLTIAKATTTADAAVSKGTEWWKGPLGGGQGYVYKDVILKIESGQTNNPKVVKYTAAVNNNTNTTKMYEKQSYNDTSYKGSYVRYQDTYLKDMSFVLKDPKTGNTQNLTKSNVNYIKKVADSVTGSVTSDYSKLLKMYEYVASKYYYDVLANVKYENQYANPYKNLYNLRNSVSSANSKSGKVATTCQGYAAMIIAMARAEGIPARLAYGHHISVPATIWQDIEDADMSKRDHWWAEAWINGHWIVIDACAATGSKWNRTSFSDAGTWKKSNFISYSYFDPSPESLANGYSYIDIYPGATDGKYINRTNEISQLRTFLNTSKDGIKNGKKLNSAYSSANFDTWGTTEEGNFKTDGYGRVTHMMWGDRDLAGTLNLTDFNKLRYVTVYNGELTKLTLTGCSQLVGISATYNNLKSFDSTASTNTTSITLRGNELTTAKFNHGSKTITISRDGKGGTFAFDYKKADSKKLTIYASKPAVGYKYMGIYNSEGKRISSQQTYSFNPSGTKYTVKYKAL